MTSKIYVADADNTGIIDLTTYTGLLKGTPFFDGNDALIEMGMRCANGEASQGTFKLMDPLAQVPTATFNIPPHKLLTWSEDAPGAETWLSRGRIATYDGGREGNFEVDDYVGFDVTVDDGNIELRGQGFTEEWVRPSETGVARVLALGAYTLAGAASTATNHRDTCEVTVDTAHLAPNTLTTTMPAKTYPPGTQPQAVIQDCADTENKIYSVVIHNDAQGSHLCLLYIANDDHTTYASPIKISDHLDDWDPTDATAPVYEPHWEMGKASLYDGQQMITGIVSEWNGQHIFAEHAPTIVTNDYWVESYSDASSVSLAQAQQVVNALINQRRLLRITHRASIIVEASQVDLVAAGMSLEVRAAAIHGGTSLDDWLTRRIVECRFEPRIDGRYWAHLHLNHALRRYPDFKGNINVPRPAQDCDESATSLIDFDWEEEPDHDETIPAYSGLGQSAVVISGTEAVSNPYGYRVSLPLYGTATSSYVWIPVTPGESYLVSIDHHVLYNFLGGAYSSRGQFVWEWNSGAFGSYSALSTGDGEILYGGPSSVVTDSFTITAPASATGVKFYQGPSPYRGWHLHGIRISEAGADEDCEEPEPVGETGDATNGDSAQYSPADHVHEHGLLGPPRYHHAAQVTYDPTDSGAAELDLQASTDLFYDHDTRHANGGDDELPAESLPTAETDTDLRLAPDGAGGVEWAAGGGGGAPTTADYLVGTAQAGLSAEIVVGATPGGELGGTWAAPTVDATHSGSTHGAAVTTHEAAADPHTGYVKESEFAAKGDILGGTASGTLDNLAVGTNGHSLVADSTQTTGLAYAARLSTADHAAIDHGVIAGVGAIGEGRPAAAGISIVVLPGVQVQTKAATAAALNTIRYSPIILQEDLELTALVGELVANGLAGRLARVGLYEADFDWQPGALVLEGEWDLTANGSKNVTPGSPISLTPGRYLLAWNVNNSSPTFRTARGSFGFVQLTTNNLILAFEASATYAALADPGTAWTALATGSGSPFLYPVYLEVDEP